MRLFAGLISGQSFDSMLVGDESLSRRPMERVVEPLRRWARRSSPGGRAPLRVTGTGRIPDHLPLAGSERAGEVGRTARRPLCGGRTEVTEPAVARSHRAHAARLRPARETPRCDRHAGVPRRFERQPGHRLSHDRSDLGLGHSGLEPGQEPGRRLSHRRTAAAARSSSGRVSCRAPVAGRRSS